MIDRQDRAAARPVCQGDRAVQLGRTLTEATQPKTAAGRTGNQAATVIAHLQRKPVGRAFQAQPGLARGGMALDVR